MSRSLQNRTYWLPLGRSGLYSSIGIRRIPTAVSHNDDPVIGVRVSGRFALTAAAVLCLPENIPSVKQVLLFARLSKKSEIFTTAS